MAHARNFYCYKKYFFFNWRTEKQRLRTAGNMLYEISEFQLELDGSPFEASKEKLETRT